MKKINLDGVEYTIQDYMDTDLEELCTKQKIKIFNKNEIYTQSDNPYSLTEYKIFNPVNKKDVYGYEVIIPHGDCWECTIITTSKKQDPLKVVEAFMKEREEFKENLRRNLNNLKN